MTEENLEQTPEGVFSSVNVDVFLVELTLLHVRSCRNPLIVGFSLQRLKLHLLLTRLSF